MVTIRVSHCHLADGLSESVVRSLVIVLGWKHHIGTVAVHGLRGDCMSALVGFTRDRAKECTDRWLTARLLHRSSLSSHD